MVRDLIGNILGNGDKVHVQLVNPNIFGFIAEIREPSLVSVNRGMEPGHLLISCVIAVPIDPALNGAVPQLAKVYDAAKAATPSQDTLAQPN